MKAITFKRRRPLCERRLENMAVGDPFVQEGDKEGTILQRVWTDDDLVKEAGAASHLAVVVMETGELVVLHMDTLVHPVRLDCTVSYIDEAEE